MLVSKVRLTSDASTMDLSAFTPQREQTTVESSADQQRAAGSSSSEIEAESAEDSDGEQASAPAAPPAAAEPIVGWPAMFISMAGYFATTSGSFEVGSVKIPCAALVILAGDGAAARFADH